MAAKHFNWKLFIVIVLSLVVLGATATGLRSYQKTIRVTEALQLGQEAHKEGRWLEAAQYLGQYISVHRAEVPVVLMYADAQLNRQPVSADNVRQAIASYRAVLRTEPTNIEAIKRLSNLYILVGSPGEAELISGRYLESHPAGDPEIMQYLAVAYIKLKRQDEAQALLEQCVIEHPGHIPAYELLAGQSQSLPSASSRSVAEWYELAVEKNPENASAYLARAGFRLRGGMSPEVLADLARVEELMGEDKSIRLRLAGAFAQVGEYARSEAILKQAAVEEPTNLTIWEVWTQLAADSNSVDRVVEVTEQALASLGNQVNFFRPRATELFIRAGKLERAAQCLNDIETSDENAAIVAYLTGWLANAKNDPQEAIQHLRRSMELGNDVPQIRLMLAQSLMLLGEQENATYEYEAAVAKFPKSLSVRLAMAQHASRIRDWETAREHAREVLLLSPKNVSALLLELNARIMMFSELDEVDDELWGDVDKSLQAMQDELGMTQQVRNLHYQAALVRGDLKQAESILGEEPEVGTTEHLQWAMAQGRLCVRRGDDQKAQEIFSDAISAYPQSVSPVRQLVLLYMRQAKREACENLLREALDRMRVDASRIELAILLSDVYVQWQQERSAEGFLVRMIQEFPNNINFRRRLLDLASVRVDTQRSQGIVDEIRAIEGEQGNLWRLEQARLWASGEGIEERYSRIVALLEFNLGANTNDQASRLLLAALHLQMGELRVAASEYRDALEREPKNLWILARAVEAHLRANEMDEAQRMLQGALEKHPTNPELLRLRAEAYLYRGETEAASRALRELFSEDSNNLEAGVMLARLVMQEGAFDEAESLIHQLEQVDKDAPDVIDTKVRIMVARGREKEAVDLCSQLIELRSDTSSYLLRAQTLSRIGDLEGATGDYEQVLRMEPNDVALRITTASFYQSIGKADRAISDIEHALALEPGNIDAQKVAVSLYLESNNNALRKQGESMLSALLKTNDRDVEVLMLKIRVLTDNGTDPDLSEALKLIDEVLKIDPRRVDAWLQQGQIHLRRGNPGLALNSAMRGLADNNNNRQLQLLRIKAEVAGSPEQAIQTLQGMHLRDPNDVEVLFFLADMYLSVDQNAQALDILRNFESQCPESEKLRCQVLIATALYRGGGRGAGEELFESLRKADNKNVLVLTTYAQVLSRDGRWDKTRDVVHRWMSTKPKTESVIAVATTLASSGKNVSVDVILGMLRSLRDRQEDSMLVLGNLAQIEQLVGRHDEAVADYRLLLEREPNNTMAMNNLAYLLSEKLEKYQEAYQLTQEALDLDSDYLDLKDTHGLVCLRLSKLDEAEKHLLDCVRLYPLGQVAGTVSRFNLGRVYMRKGNRREAAKWLKEALDMNKRIGGLAKSDATEAAQLIYEITGQKI
ncbi:tetratricopeptide repeat protein [Planctomycetota bacterium]